MHSFCWLISMELILTPTAAYMNQTDSLFFLLFFCKAYSAVWSNNSVITQIIMSHDKEVATCHLS